MWKENVCPQKSTDLRHFPVLLSRAFSSFLLELGISRNCRGSRNSWNRIHLFIHQIHLFFHQIHLFFHQIHLFIHQIHLLIHQIHLFFHQIHLFIHEMHLFIQYIHLFIHQIHLFIHKIHLHPNMNLFLSQPHLSSIYRVTHKGWDCKDDPKL